jgi:hypothetical protein
VIAQPVDHTADSLTAQIATTDLVPALRLRIASSAFRFDAEQSTSAPDHDGLVQEVGTGLSLTLKLGDDFAFVAMARRHCQPVSIVSLHEILRVIKHAANLSATMARQNPRFAKAAALLEKESSMWALHAGVRPVQGDAD